MLSRTYFTLASTKRIARKGRPSDNSPVFDKGPVEWLPRPVRLTFSTIDAAREFIMRQTLDGKTEEVDKIRELQRQWHQHPQRPVLGDCEPKFPRMVYKDNHHARRRFIIRWHRANTPNQWLWLPRTGNAPEHRARLEDYPEYWNKQKRIQQSMP